MDNLKMNELIEIDTHEYLEKLKESFECNRNNKFYRNLNKQLFKMISINPSKSIKLCKISIEVYKDNRRKSLCGKIINILIKALIAVNNGVEYIVVFKEGINYAIEKNLYNEGLEMLESFDIAVGKFGYGEEEYLEFIKCSVYLYNNFQLYNKSIDLMCYGAKIFSKVNAFQSAYRLLNDAETLAIENNMSESIIKILSNEAEICIEEGDSATAEIIYEKLVSLAGKFNENLPEQILANIATVKMKKGKFKVAQDIFKELLNKNKDSLDWIVQLKVNLAVCEREMRDFESAIDNIEYVIRNKSILRDNEQVIEAYLVGARVYLESSRFNECIDWIYQCISHIEGLVSNMIRLHYRRGIRERYFDRVLGLLFEVPNEYLRPKHIDILILSKINIFSDWLSVLDWCEEIMNDDEVSNNLKQKLSTSLQKLINLGTPILLGFREKYDDPFEDYGQCKGSCNEWQEFNVLVKKIMLEYGKESMFEKSKIKIINEIITNKVNEGAVYIFVYVTGGELNFYVCSNKGIKSIKIDAKYLVKYITVLFKYRRKLASFQDFVQQLKECVDKLSEDMSEIFDEIIACNPKEIVFIPDKVTTSLPLISSIIADNNCREYLKKSDTIIKYMPIVYHSKHEERQYQKFLGILDPAFDLPMLEEELKLINREDVLCKHQILNISEREIDYNDFNEEEIIHIASHGIGISSFTDPIYASIAGPLSENKLTLEEIQRNYWKMNYNLVINNACDSADITNRNFYKEFKTNEIISYSSLFLMNRKSVAIAVAWPMKDITAYVFSHIFYKKLLESNKSCLSYIKTLLEIYDLTKENLLEIFNDITIPELREEKLRLFEHATNEYPFRHPYSYGGYIINSLL